MKHRKNLTRLLCCLLCLCMCLSACKKAPETTTTAPQENAKDAIYTITLKTAGGMVLNNVAVYVYEDATEDDLLTYGNLDNNGAFTFTAPESDKYTVRFAGLPKEGYDVQPYYPITSKNTDIVITSSVITGLDALEEGKTYGLGDVMRDFVITTVDGEEMKLSEILKEKQAVVLNFWYTGCGPCKNEFPLLQAAYEAYSDKIEVIAMNPTDISRDTVEGIKAFRDDNGLTMPMAVCSSQWFGALGINAYPTTVVIDRYGVVCLITGTVEEPGAFESVFEHFTAENYQQKLVEDISELHTVEYPEGHERNPYQTHGAAGQFQVTVPAQSEYHVLIYKADGITLHIENPNAYVLYGEERYDPNANGIIEVVIDNPDMMVGSSVIIGNAGSAETTVTVELLIPQGTMSTPYEAVLGPVTVDVAAGNDQGVYYSWIASEAGILTLTVLGQSHDNFDVQLYNTATMAVRNLGEEILVDENGNRYVCVEVNAGDEVRIGYMSIPDANNNYPAVTIEAELSFAKVEELETEYSITITDEGSNPIENVEVIVIIDGQETQFFTDAEGKIVMALPSGTYTVKVMVPEGYTCETAQFLLSVTNPTKEVVFHRVVQQPVTYTVNVTDETGAPVANALVILDGVTYYTDENGVFSFELLESDAYTVTVVAPEGYILEDGEFAFGTEKTINVTMRLAEVEPENVEYKVHVKDHNGKPVTDVQVRLDAENGSNTATAVVDANGCATFMLPKTNYIVTVILDGKTGLGYEPTGNKLTPSKTELTIELVPYVSGTTEEIYVKDADRVAYYVQTGSHYVDLTQEDIRFFLFAPTQPGIYTITTTNANAPLGYWGGNLFFINYQPDGVKNNVCTIEVKEAGPTYIFSVSGGEGITGTVLKITRTGNATQDPERVNFVGTTEPTQPFVVQETGTKTYFDLSIAHTLVKGSDGYYHYGSEDGAIVYMDLKGAQYGISISTVLSTSAMFKMEYDSNGNAVRRIDYTNCMNKYVENADETHGVYALTDDLITIIQNHGNQQGWYEKNGNGYYLFEGENVLPESAWMFLLCTFQ